MNTIKLFQNDTDTVKFKAGEKIFREGDEGTVMYAIRSGEVDIFYDHKLLETVLPGGIFGELVLIDEDYRSATAIVKEDCELVKVDRERFMSIVTYNPFFALQVMEVLAARLRRQTSM